MYKIKFNLSEKGILNICSIINVKLLNLSIIFIIIILKFWFGFDNKY